MILGSACECHRSISQFVIDSTFQASTAVARYARERRARNYTTINSGLQRRRSPSLVFTENLDSDVMVM
jgi:hypothetical protein